MKVLLIKPPLNPYLLAPNHDEPLELEYLAAAAAGHDVEILDMRIDRDLDRTLRRFRPDLAGITAYTCDVRAARTVLREVKKFSGRIKTAVGGHHATVIPGDFALPVVDAIFIGLADDSFREYVGLLAAGGDVSGVPNIALVDGDRLVPTERAPFPTSLDLLPFPDRRPTLKYRRHYRDSLNNRTGLVVTSRGCPHRCTFCACWKIMEGRYMARNAESIVEEIVRLPDDVDLVCFADDNTLHNVARARRIIELIQERRIRKRYMMYARADTIVRHPDLMEGLRDIGLDYLLIGIESFEDETLRGLNKKVTSRTNVEALRLLKRLGIRVSPHLIVDPEFARRDFRDLYRNVCELGLAQPVFTVLTPLPGTELFEKCSGRLAIRDYDFFDFTHSVLPTRLGRKEFYREYARLYAKSYSPWRQARLWLRSMSRGQRTDRRRGPGRREKVSFLRVARLFLFGLPWYLKVRRNYKVEPVIDAPGLEK